MQAELPPPVHLPAKADARQQVHARRRIADTGMSTYTTTATDSYTYQASGSTTASGATAYASLHYHDDSYNGSTLTGQTISEEIITDVTCAGSHFTTTTTIITVGLSTGSTGRGGVTGMVQRLGVEQAALELRRLRRICQIRRQFPREFWKRAGHFKVVFQPAHLFQPKTASYRLSASESATKSGRLTTSRNNGSSETS